MQKKLSLHVCVCQQKRWDGGRGAWDHLQGAVHTAAARLGWPWLTPGGPIFILAAVYMKTKNSSIGLAGICVIHN